MTKLSDTQSIILSQASQHEASLATAPKNLPTAARQAVFRSMLKNQLLEEVPAPTEHRNLGWRQDEEGAWVALRITNDGLRAIGAKTEEPTTEPRELTAEEEAEELDLQQEALDAENEAEVALGETAPVAAPAQQRMGLQEAATATVAAWQAQDGLEAALEALKASLTGRAPVRVSARGQAVHDDLRPKGRAQQERILVPLAPEERPLFLDMLTRLVEAHEAYARPGNGRRRLTRPAPSDASSNAAAAD